MKDGSQSNSIHTEWEIASSGLNMKVLQEPFVGGDEMFNSTESLSYGYAQVSQ